MGERLYDLPTFQDQDDYIGNVSLAVIGHTVEALPTTGFEVGAMNATNTSVTATVYFPGASATTQLDTMEAVLRLATVARTLYANLVAARAALASTTATPDSPAQVRPTDRTTQ